VSALPSLGRRKAAYILPITGCRKGGLGSRDLAIEPALIELEFEMDLIGFEVAEIDLILDEASRPRLRVKRPGGCDAQHARLRGSRNPARRSLAARHLRSAAMPGGGSLCPHGHEQADLILRTRLQRADRRPCRGPGRFAIALRHGRFEMSPQPSPPSCRRPWAPRQLPAMAPSLRLYGLRHMRAVGRRRGGIQRAKRTRVWNKTNGGMGSSTVGHELVCLQSGSWRTRIPVSAIPGVIEPRLTYPGVNTLRPGRIRIGHAPNCKAGRLGG
jgi:hypothetical protein